MEELYRAHPESKQEVKLLNQLTREFKFLKKKQRNRSLYYTGSIPHFWNKF